MNLGDRGSNPFMTTNFKFNIYGKELTKKERELIEEYINNNYPLLEYYSIDGEQEIYDVILIME